jgi:hypothetical protein
MDCHRSHATGLHPSHKPRRLARRRSSTTKHAPHQQAASCCLDQAPDRGSPRSHQAVRPARPYNQHAALKVICNSMGTATAAMPQACTHHTDHADLLNTDPQLNKTHLISRPLLAALTRRLIGAATAAIRQRGQHVRAQCRGRRQAQRMQELLRRLRLSCTVSCRPCRTHHTLLLLLLCGC